VVLLGAPKFPFIFRKRLKIGNFMLQTETLVIEFVANYPPFKPSITTVSRIRGRHHIATFKQLASGKWQAQIFNAGKRTSKSFPAKKAAKDWAKREEYLAINAEPVGSTMLMIDVFGRYGREVSVTRRGEPFECLRFDNFGRDKIGSIPISEIGSLDLVDWRDRRLLEVQLDLSHER
jgi:hypothetical protein